MNEIRRIKKNKEIKEGGNPPKKYTTEELVAILEAEYGTEDYAKK